MSILENIVVIDLGQNISGPIAATLLAAMGAQVIKVEVPGLGDNSRLGPPYIGDEGVSFTRTNPTDPSLSFLKRNRNKKSVAIDMKSAGGRKVFARLLEKAGRKGCCSSMHGLSCAPYPVSVRPAPTRIGLRTTPSSRRSAA